MEADDPQQAGPGTVLITGGGGLIGTALAAALLRDGNAVERTSRRELDVRDARAVRDRVVALEPRVIFHLAGDSDLARCARDPDMAAELHVGGTRNVLDAAARLAQPPAFVCASTRHVYDHDAGAGPIGERGTFVTTPGYGETRARADLLVMASRDVPAASLRLTNVYGPGDPRSGRIVPVIESSIRHRRPIELLAGSSRQLELLHVDDAVAAYLALAAALVAGRRGVAGGRPHSRRDVQRGRRPKRQDGGNRSVR